MKRRDFITIVGTSALAAPLIGTASGVFSSIAFAGHKFPNLGLVYNALEPYIDAQTMELHYDKHHRGYYTKFMAAAEGTELLNMPMPDIFASVSNYGETIRNNGGGYYNHTLFWENLTPERMEIPLNLKSALEKDFGSVDSFKEKFGSVAKKHFGSGWVWLAIDSKGKLFVSETLNQDNPLMDLIPEKGVPLLTVDVWEHAYYLLYQNRRPEYVDNFWNIVNWDIVNKRLEKFHT